MSVKDILKKIKDFFSPILSNLGTHIDRNFGQIIKIILLIGVVVVVVSVIIGIMSRQGQMNSEINIKATNFQSQQQREVDFNMLMNNEIILPTNSTFDLSCDYVDFMILKEYTPPKIDMVVKDYKKILDEAIDEELQFGFEVRGSNEKKTK